MSKFNEFMEALEKAPNAEELMGGKGKPESDEEMIAAYVAAAEALGFDLAEQDVVEGIRAAEQERLAMTEQAQAGLAELPDEELDKIAGGKQRDYCKSTQNMNCKDTFEDYENCWNNDACDFLYHYYPNDYKCKRNVNGDNQKWVCGKGGPC